MTRTRLPNRRQGISRSFEWKQQIVDITIGFDGDGEAREVFLNDAGKIGSDLMAVLHDACVLMSLCLQSGIDAAELYKSLGRQSNSATGEPSDEAASVVGEIAHCICNTEFHHGREMTTNRLGSGGKVACGFTDKRECG